MKNIIFLSFLFASLVSFSRSTWIPVELIFDSTVNVIDMRVISYEGDTVLIYLDLKDNNIKRFACKTKGHSSRQARDTSLNSLKNNWYGQFPIKGEIIKLIQFKYGKRILYNFAKKIGYYYKIWDPLDIPFAHYTYLIPKNSIFSGFCELDSFENNTRCQKLVMKAQDFEREILF